MEPPLLDVHMNIPAWPGLIAAVGVLITRVSALDVRDSDSSDCCPCPQQNLRLRCDQEGNDLCTGLHYHQIGKRSQGKGRVTYRGKTFSLLLIFRVRRAL